MFITFFYFYKEKPLNFWHLVLDIKTSLNYHLADIFCTCTSARNLCNPSAYPSQCMSVAASRLRWMTACSSSSSTCSGGRHWMIAFWQRVQYITVDLYMKHIRPNWYKLGCSGTDRRDCFNETRVCVRPLDIMQKSLNRSPPNVACILQWCLGAQYMVNSRENGNKECKTCRRLTPGSAQRYT